MPESLSQELTGKESEGTLIMECLEGVALETIEDPGGSPRQDVGH